MKGINHKKLEGCRNVAFITVPTDALACSKFLEEHKLSLRKGKDYFTGNQNVKCVPEIWDTLRHEDGLVVKVRDFEVLPDHRFMRIAVSNNNPNTQEAVFQSYFYDFLNDEVVTIRPKHNHLTIITKIQIF